MAYDAFIYFPGASPAVEGETNDSAMKAHKAIQMYSFSWGASNPTTAGHAGGMAGGKVSLSSFNFMKKTDTASAALFLLCANGGHVPTATILLRKAGGTAPLPFITYTLSEVFVESYQVSGSEGGDDSPTESISLAFNKIEISYQAQGADGKAAGGAKTATWNQGTNSTT